MTRIQKHVFRISTLVFGLAIAQSFSFAAGVTAPPSGIRPYVEVFGDFSVLPGINATDTFFFFGGPGKVNEYIGANFGGIVGLRFNDHLRGELELSQLNNAVQNFTFNSGSVSTYKGGNVQQTFALANVWYDFDIHSKLVPYVGGGVGVGWANGNIDVGGGSYINATSPAGLALQVGVGANYRFSEHVSLDVGYRLKAITGLNPQVTTNYFGPYTIDQTKVLSHNLQVGLTYQF